MMNGSAAEFEIEKAIVGINDSNQKILAAQQAQVEAIRVQSEVSKAMIQEIQGLRKDLLDAALNRTPEGTVPLKTHYLTLIVALGIVKLDAFLPYLKNILNAF